MSDSEPVARCPDRLAHWLARHTPSCQEVTRLTSERLDRRLSLRERISIRLHFVICFLCRRYDHQVHLLHQRLQTDPDAFSQCGGGALSAEEKARIKAACTQLPP